MNTHIDCCSTCGATAPHMHPAVQHGGEVEVCTNDFHLKITPQNTFAYIDAVYAKRATRSRSAAPGEGS